MILDIRDVDLVRPIQPVDAALSLRANGWTVPVPQARPAAHRHLWLT